MVNLVITYELQSIEMNFQLSICAMFGNRWMNERNVITMYKTRSQLQQFSIQPC